MNKKISDVLTLSGLIIFVLLIGFLSSIFPGVSFKETYVHLIKPSFFPPAWLFAPVWTILYILIGISAFLVWRKQNEKNINLAVTIFLIQLFLNYVWSIIFFGKGNYFLALVDIVALWFAIGAMIKIFSKISKTAAWVLLPYWLWVSFAAVLNYYAWILN